MSHRRAVRRLVVSLAALAAIAAIAPALAGARTLSFGSHLRVHVPQSRGRWMPARTYGATTLALDPSTAAALQSLGVTPGVIAPATAGPGGLSFPITDSPLQAAFTRAITHSGGISLSAGSTEVDLTDFWISLGSSPSLSAEVGGSRVTILDLDLSGARVRLRHGSLTVGPVLATLTPAAASALNAAFGVSAFTPGLTLGTATIDYRRFGSW